MSNLERVSEVIAGVLAAAVSALAWLWLATPVTAPAFAARVGFDHQARGYRLVFVVALFATLGALRYLWPRLRPPGDWIIGPEGILYLFGVAAVRWVLVLLLRPASPWANMTLTGAVGLVGIALRIRWDRPLRDGVAGTGPDTPSRFS